MIHLIPLKDLNVWIFKKIVEEVAEKKSSKHKNVQKRGVASIPLPGIDVPFHSKFLRSGVSTFRNILRSLMDVENIKVNRLLDLYIPNLVAKPFSLSKEIL